MITEFGFTELNWSPASSEQQAPSGAKPQNGTPQSSAPPRIPAEQKLEPVITRTGHWILKENQYYRNGEFCQDSRDVRILVCSSYPFADSASPQIEIRIWKERDSTEERIHPPYSRTYPACFTEWSHLYYFPRSFPRREVSHISDMFGVHQVDACI